MKTAKVEYYVAELYWGQGIGKSAVKQLCEYVFKIRI
ncbi:GNAT family N-acetyltransferase [Bacteroides congonensis]